MMQDDDTRSKTSDALKLVEAFFDYLFDFKPLVYTYYTIILMVY